MEDRKLFDVITDHPKLSGCLAFVAIAISFTPKSNISATYTALSAAWVFAVGMIAGLPIVKGTKGGRVKVTFAALALLVLLFFFASWLTGSNSGASVRAKLFLVAKAMVLLGLGNLWGQRFLCVIFGMLLLQTIQISLRSLNAWRVPKERPAGPKGFLDYKLQAEESISGLNPIINDLTKIMGKVSALFRSKTLRIKQDLSTRVQLRRVGSVAESLRRFSMQLDAKCAELEEKGAGVAEGTSGWLKWMSNHENRRAVGKELGTHIRAFAFTLDKNVHIIDEYLNQIELGRGISKQMNEAIDSHLTSVRRIRAATDGIRKSCLDALVLIENF